MSVGVQVGYGDGVREGASVLRTVGVKMGFGISTGALSVNVDAGCDNAVLQAGMTSMQMVRIKNKILVLESLLINQFFASQFFWQSHPIDHWIHWAVSQGIIDALSIDIVALMQRLYNRQ